MEKVIKDLVNFENALLDCVDNRYNEDDELEVEREVTLRSTMYMTLVKLRESIYDENGQIERKRFEMEKKINELTIEKERLEEKLKKLRARVNSPDPYIVFVNGLGPNSRYIISHAEAMVNERLNHIGFVTLADVYEELGLDKPDSPIAVVCGWRSEYTDAIHFEVYGHEEEDKYIVVMDDYRPIL